MHIDHIAFVVASLEEAMREVTACGLPLDQPREFPAEGTRECYVGQTDRSARLLLIEAIGEGPYASAMARRGPGLHHIGVNVSDIDAFLDGLEGSGWYVHPRSFRTRQEANTIWLARPGVEVLVEVHEMAPMQASPFIEELRVAGLEPRTRQLFEHSAIPIEAGTPSAVRLGGAWMTFGGLAAINIDDAYEYNREAWNTQVRAGNRWTVPVTPEEVAGARSGNLEIVLTPQKQVPAAWLGTLNGRDVLCLASGGGQQGPLFAASGANATVFDASDDQLARDREVADREGLDIRTIRGDMRDLGALADGSFDLVFHPCSNCFVEEVRPVWREAFRVLRPGGELLAGFNNPVGYCFDWLTVERGEPRLRYKLPYRDLDHLDHPFVAAAVAANDPLEFGHTLADQIGGQLDAGFELIDFFEDEWGSGYFPDNYFAGFFATRARKPVQ